MGKIFRALEKAENKVTPENQSVSGDDSDGHASGHSAAIPQPGARHANPDLVTAEKPYSHASEQFRLLKNNILFPEKGNPPKTIMVTSASPHEGKSFVAANLAVSIAQSIDEYVLLMDCDLRAPTIHTFFGYEGNDQGLSDYLTNSIPLSSVLKKASVNKLTILTAGQIPSNPSELLSSDQMRRLLQEVKLRYNDRYIIIDTPPPYMTSETNAIARFVDGIILVIRQGKTRTKEVADILDIYGREKVLGVVTNFARKKIGYGYGYNKSGHGYGYHQER
ncbi:polysaccharide biosynthesis tyrosine autokinase [Desulfobacter latus]|uniref:Polysaccharide biosynthesis tyrosine autokinase n=1 Tax=Desulfobacter latus TaxID=2292 RepID=A0A850T4Q7_9BACT|nr:polysaccharide biosynthesis tyrosine autokinase [Desulfobacter latus]NWH06071.1 polysaccharide biosynthesis tyrosine autokinase [Desulfobacter latus]